MPGGPGIGTKSGQLLATGWSACFASAMTGDAPVVREQRKLAAVLAADVVGYSRLMGRDESGTLARLRHELEGAWATA